MVNIFCQMFIKSVICNILDSENIWRYEKTKEKTWKKTSQTRERNWPCARSRGGSGGWAHRRGTCPCPRSWREPVASKSKKQINEWKELHQPNIKESSVSSNHNIVLSGCKASTPSIHATSRRAALPDVDSTSRLVETSRSARHNSSRVATPERLNNTKTLPPSQNSCLRFV